MIEQRKKFDTAQVASAPAERRNHPRYPCTTTAEVLDSQTGTRVNGRTSDIGKGGCYVDTLNPLPTGTAVKIQRTKDKQSFMAQGKVCYSMTGLGQGLRFASVDRSRCGRWRNGLLSLAGLRRLRLSWSK